MRRQCMAMRGLAPCRAYAKAPVNGFENCVVSPRRAFASDFDARFLMPPPLIEFAVEGQHREVEDWCRKSSLLQPLDLDITDGHGNTALIHAAGLGSVRAVNEAIEKGMTMAQAMQREAAMVQERCPAYALECFAECVLSLLSHGADVNRPGQNGGTPLQWAAIVGFPPVLHALLEAGASVNHPDNDGNTALLHVVQWAHTEVPPGAYQATAHLLVDGGADPRVVNKQGESAQSVLLSRLTKEEDSGRQLADLVDILQLEPLH